VLIQKNRKQRETKRNKATIYVNKIGIPSFYEKELLKPIFPDVDELEFFKKSINYVDSNLRKRDVKKLVISYLATKKSVIEEKVRKKAEKNRDLGFDLMDQNKTSEAFEVLQEAKDIYLTLSSNSSDLVEIEAILDYLRSEIKEKIDIEQEELKKKQFERESIEQIQKMMKVSSKIRLIDVIKTLDIEEKTFYQNIWDWAEKYNLKIDGDFITIEESEIDPFMEHLDKQFELWKEKEKSNEKGKKKKTL